MAVALQRARSTTLADMQLVEPRKEGPVPNHLLETKIYSKIGQNDVVQARPAVVHFAGFEVNKTHTQKLFLINVATEVHRMDVIPPQTKYFYIKYTKQDRLVAGSSLVCTVEFTPDEWRYYYDCIRVHTKGDGDNIIIPIHAYPVMNPSDFPSHIKFPHVPVGQSEFRVVPLRCRIPVDFEFQIEYVQPNEAFTINPMSGVVPANGETDITVMFSPTQFNTCFMKLQIVLSQFQVTPIVCTITGSSVPGLEKERSLALGGGDLSILDPRAVSPLHRARAKRKMRLQETSAGFSQRQKSEPMEEYRGLKVPTHLNTPHGVAQILLQEPGKMKMQDLRKAVLSRTAKDSTAPTKQMKEAMFEMALRKDIYEERQNQLRWQVKIGEGQMSHQDRQVVMVDRAEAWEQYKHKRGDPVVKSEYERTESKLIFRRTVRDASEVAPRVAKFDTYVNDMFAVRHHMLNQFQQAARTVIIRNRANQRLVLLRHMILEWGNIVIHPVTSRELREDVTDPFNSMSLHVTKIKGITFPTYVSPDVKDDMAVDALGVVPYMPTEVVIKKKVPYFNLKVPRVYKLLGYEAHDVHEASSNYVPPNLMRTLRTGAEDEIIQLPAPPVVSDQKQAVEIPKTPRGMEVARISPSATPCPKMAIEHHPLVPPQALFQPITYPPLHIFNPSPGLQVFHGPMPFAETDVDFHLCPLPRYAFADINNQHRATQKQYLDREDVIRGVMAWKRFPSQGLMSLSNTATLSNVWVPRWSDSFGSDLLPQSVPEQLNGLPPEEDVADIDQEEEEKEEEVVQLTPEMIKAQFPFIQAPSDVTAPSKNKKSDMFPEGNRMPPTNLPVSSTGPVPRERREQELDYFLKKKYNRLGSKIEARIENLDRITTMSQFVLK
ncbi:hypothetical protein NP493_535g01047 [Ridgeia piscesae]|uniref:Cep192-like domain-containing protein n=1 Tax=Ridgeia piscesae TaxID=27915 RepID=A0AAD9KW81_RIDPI|nr:hypothetical protein NP493_535g01047 [Ridgeia piscesae]